MKPEQRILNIQELIRHQTYLNGLTFHVEHTSIDQFKVIFDKINTWQLTRLKERLFEFRMTHITVVGKEVLNEPKPHKRRRRRRKPGTSTV